MSTTATRLIHLIMLLQRQPGQKASGLAAELGVSVRTLHRYFSMLDEMGIPIYSERGPHGGFSLVRGYKLPPLVFSPEEAAAVYLGANLVEEMWGQLYRQAARSALAKLENLLPDEQRHEVAWARRSLAASGMHRAAFDDLAPKLDTLRRAVRERCSVQLVYQSGNQPDKSKRVIDPLALIHRWGWWYAAAFCHMRQAVRTFRVDRIVEITILEAVFETPADFDLRNYLSQEPHTQPGIVVRVRFFPEAAQVAFSNRAYWDDLASQPDGSVIVTFTAPTLEWAASSVLAYGPIVEAVEPAELRKVMAQWVRVIARTYEGAIENGENRFTEAI